MTNKHNPVRYSQMCAPRKIAEAEVDIANFMNDVREARIRHRLADVTIVVRVFIDNPDGEVAACSSAHFGAVQEGEGMLAWALARAAENRRKFVAMMTSQGTAHAQSDD